MLATVYVQKNINFKPRYVAKADKTWKLDDESFDENIDDNDQNNDKNNENNKTNGVIDI